MGAGVPRGQNAESRGGVAICLARAARPKADRGLFESDRPRGALAKVLILALGRNKCERKGKGAGRIGWHGRKKGGRPAGRRAEQERAVAGKEGAAKRPGNGEKRRT